MESLWILWTALSQFLPESAGSTISPGPEEGTRGEGEKPVLAEEIAKAHGHEAVL